MNAMLGKGKKGDDDSSGVSQVLLPRPYPKSDGASLELSESTATSGTLRSDHPAPSSDRQVAMDESHVKSHAFSMHWFRKLRDVSRLFIGADRRSWLPLAALALMQAGLIFLQSLVGPVIGSFYSSIIDNNTQAFSKNLQWALFVFACISVTDAVLKWLSEGMEVTWRRALATRLHTMYGHP
jgi:ABC-type uncharacterized transport system fused permease/ATPase subunit